MKNNDLLQKRNSAVDIIRIVAVFSVLSVHFFLHNGFYGDNVMSGGNWVFDLPIPFTSLRVALPWELVTINVRVITSVCVPLFMILTGYLMSQKTVSGKYYKGIRKTLIVYVLATFVCMLVEARDVGGIKGVEFTLRDFVLGLFNFKGNFSDINHGIDQYSWYVEMYIGLFLIAPFLNLAYNGAKTKGKKQLLVFSFFAISVLPTLLNYLHFDNLDWWGTLRYADNPTKILPAFWGGLYPIAYYFAGAYFREYGLKMRTRSLLICFLAAWFLFGAFNYTMFLDSGYFSGSPFITWNSIMTFVLSCALFVLLTRIPANKAPKSVRVGLWRVSDLAFGAYLLSFIFDRYTFNSWFTSDSDMPWDKYITQIFYISLHIIVAVAVFLLVRFLAKKLTSEGMVWLLWRVTGIALGVYLLCVLEWHHGTQMWFQSIASFESDLKITRFFVMTIPRFICSLLASLVVNCVADLIIAAYEKVRDFIKSILAGENRARWQDIAFISLLAGGIVFAIWKAHYGFGGYDESFYLTIPHRLGMGDALFRDEWNLSLLSGVLMVPFVKIYTLIVGSCEGIILAMRIFYTFAHAGVALLLYWRIRKYGPLTIFASMLFFMFVPYNIMSYGYNHLALDLLVVAGVLMATADYSKKVPVPVIISGLAFAGAVLCAPYLMAGYVIYILCVIAHLVIARVDKDKKLKFTLTTETFSLKTFLWFTAGAAALAVVVVGSVAIKSGIGSIFDNVPNMMIDPEHTQTTLTEKLANYQKKLVECHPNFYLALWAYAGTLLVMIFDKKRRTHRAPYLVVSIMIAVFSLIMFIPKMETYYYNALVFPMIFVGITSYILCENKPRTMFASMFMLGVIYSVAVCFGSNQGFFVISIAISVSNIASFVFLAQLIREMRQTEDNLDYALFLKRTAFVGVAFMLALLGICTVVVRANHCFWESRGTRTVTKSDGNTVQEYLTITETLDTKIESGPAKGIMTVKARADDYEAGYKDLEYFNTVPKDNILYLSKKTWDFLSVKDMGYGTYSAWMSLSASQYLPAALEKLDTFYEGNPAKRPRYVYVPLNSPFDVEWDMDMLEPWLEKHGYAEIPGQTTAYGKKYISVK